VYELVDVVALEEALGRTLAASATLVHTKLGLKMRQNNSMMNRVVEATGRIKEEAKQGSVEW